MEITNLTTKPRGECVDDVIDWCKDKNQNGTIYGIINEVSDCAIIMPRREGSITRRMAIANGTCVSFCNHLRHILASPGYAPETIAVNITWMERGFNAGQRHRSMYPSISCTQPFTSYSEILVGNCNFFLLPLHLKFREKVWSSENYNHGQPWPTQPSIPHRSVNE